MKTVDEKDENRIKRLIKIIQIFLEQDRVLSSRLSDKFNVKIRTIQRDLKVLRDMNFPINTITKGSYRLDKTLFKNYEFFDEKELALILSLQDAVVRLGPLFQNAADSVFNRLYKSIGEKPVSPIFINIEKPSLLDNRLFIRAVKAIQLKRMAAFEYEVHSPYTVTIEPYKIVYFDGLWYLIGKDVDRDSIRTYALDKIKEFRMLKQSFRQIPDDFDPGVWFSGERKKEVIIEVVPDCAHQFKRRKIFPTQETVKEHDDGSLVVLFKVGNLEEIKHILKKWLPYIKIIKPAKLKNELLEEMTDWIKWQKKLK